MYAYDMTNEQLLNAFAKAAAEAGIAGSGLCIDVMTGSKFAEFNYLKGAVLSRLERLKPPFTRGDEVVVNVVKPRITAQPRHPNYSPVLKSDTDKILVVFRAYYMDEEWFLSFRDFVGEESPLLYPVEDFELKKKQ